LQELAAERRADGWCEPTVSVALEDVLDDGTRLADRDAVVLDDGKLAKRRVLRERVRGAVEVDPRELVRDAELLEEPADADGAGTGGEPELEHDGLFNHRATARSKRPVVARAPTVAGSPHPLRHAHTGRVVRSPS
jgi:hypothetical protein